MQPRPRLEKLKQKVVKVKSPLWIRGRMAVFRMWFFIYGILSYLPYKLFNSLAEKFRKSDRVKDRCCFCTGDIGQKRDDGSTLIIDRKKDPIELIHGEYVSLAKVGCALLNCPLLDNIYVYGDSFADHIVALVIPNQKHLEKIAKEVGEESTDMKAMCENQKVNAEFLKQMSEYAKQGNLSRVEMPKQITLLPEIWTPDTGLLTEAFKLVRKPIRATTEELLSGNNDNAQFHDRVIDKEIDRLKQHCLHIGRIFHAMGEEVFQKNSKYAQVHEEVAHNEINRLKRHFLYIGRIFQTIVKEMSPRVNEDAQVHEGVVDNEINSLKRYIWNIGCIFQAMGKEVVDNGIDNLRQHILDIIYKVGKLLEVAENERGLDWTIECLRFVVDHVSTLQKFNIGLGIRVEEISNVLLTGADGQLVNNDQVFDPLSIFETLIGEFKDWLIDHPEEEPIVPDSPTSPPTFIVKKCDPRKMSKTIKDKKPYGVYKGASAAALIIGASDYSKSDPKMDSLPGVNADVRNLKHFLTQLKFSVDICENQSAKTIRQTIKKWSMTKEVQEASSIFVVLAGHGDHETFIANDGDSIPIFDLIQCIDNLHCPSGDPRPKIILNLCCRGGLAQVGNKYEKPKRHHMNKLYYLIPEVNPNEDIQITEATEIVPAFGDFLFIDSTGPFSVAIDEPKGNPFLNLFIRKLSEKCHKMDIISILQEINCELPMDTSGTITQPFFSSSLKRWLYLCPGFGTDEFEQGQRLLDAEEGKKIEEAFECGRQTKIIEDQNKEIEQLRRKLKETQNKLEETQRKLEKVERKSKGTKKTQGPYPKLKWLQDKVKIFVPKKKSAKNKNNETIEESTDKDAEEHWIAHEKLYK
ncbi:hypothetical protein WR25_07197 isoform A [Diploscapter pachys]|uniref:Caspase family p20 domain-containing protein n=1 Tax=Diploscapter pachys TaxID=2018661 RepID=A0A2A2KG09_9BILA|nr:hypothetical protein WR25_07197 isoform A [Diploscapter pachys]